MKTAVASLSPSTRAAFLVLVSCLATSFVATRMFQMSSLQHQLLKVGPGGCYSPRLRPPFNAADEGSKCVA